VPIQFTVPAKAAEGDLLAHLDGGDVGLVDVDPEPHDARVGDGEDLRRPLDGLPLHGVPGDDRAAQRRDDVQERRRVLLRDDALEPGVVEPEVLEPLGRVQQGGLGLVQGRQGLDLPLAGEHALPRQRLRPVVGDPGEPLGRLGGDVLRLGGAHLGRVDDRDDLARLDDLAEVGAHFAQEAGDPGRDVGVAVGVVSRLGVRLELMGVVLLGDCVRLDADLLGELGGGEPHRGEGLAADLGPRRGGVVSLRVEPALLAEGFRLAVRGAPAVVGERRRRRLAAFDAELLRQAVPLRAHLDLVPLLSVGMALGADVLRDAAVLLARLERLDQLLVAERAELLRDAVLLAV
jgi:hypothetical protein